MTKDEIIELIKSPAAASELSAALAMQRKHKLHVNGVGFEEAIQAQAAFESDNSYKIKSVVARAETPALFAQIINVYQKIFRVDGTTILPKFKNDDKATLQAAKEYLKNISFGLSDWELMKVRWFRAMFEDFHGFLMIENPAGYSVNPDSFVKFIQTKDIHDICVIGKEIQYLILELAPVEIAGTVYKRFRYIDKIEDSIWLRDGDEIKRALLGNGNPDTLTNPFGMVPAIQISQVMKDTEGDFRKRSPIEIGMNHADQYFDIANDHAVSVKLHQHAIFYSFPVTCPDCSGKGERFIAKKDKDGDSPLAGEGISLPPGWSEFTCRTCSGVGQVQEWKRDPTKSITIPIPEDNQNGLGKAEAPCGYVTPPVESLQEERIELENKSQLIEKSILGTKGMLERKDKQQTAEGQTIDYQPIFDMLDAFSANAEQVHEFILTQILKMKFADKFVSCTVHYGRKYLLKTEAELTLELKQAKDNGCSATYIREIMEEIMKTRFEHNPDAMARALMLLEIEPFPSYTVQEVITTGVARPIDVQFKLYFNDLIEEFERENGSVVNYKEASTYDVRISEIKKDLYLRLNELLSENDEQENSGS